MSDSERPDSPQVDLEPPPRQAGTPASSSELPTLPGVHPPAWTRPGEEAATPSLPVAAPTSPSPAPPPGQTLAGRYTVLEPLGQGGMGMVVAAYDRRLDRRVALKLRLEQLGANEAVRTRMLREAQAMARLKHPHVITVYDAGPLEDGGLFIAMEMVEGQTLAQWLQEQPRPWRQVLAIFLAAGRGLAAAHAQGIIHRDFKPANVLVGRDGRVQVGDFGVARVEGAHFQEAHTPTAALPAPPPDSWETPLTQPGLLVGTPKYLAPELLRGSPADERSDLFSFCVALYEALYGQPAFPGLSVGERTRARLEGRPSPPPARSPVPGWVARAVLQGLRAEPRQRPASLAALVALLEDDPEARRRARLRLAATAALTLALATLAAVGWVRRQDSCGQMEQRLAGVWDEPLRQRLREAFLGTGLGYAPATFERTAATLDAYASDWVLMRTEVCEAGQRKDAQRELDALRASCLEQRHGHLRALTQLLARGPDRELLAEAVKLAAGLPPVRACADTEALAAAFPLPTDPQRRARVEALQQTLNQMEALGKAGKYREALALGEPLRPQVEQVDHPPLRARLLLLLAQQKQRLGEPTQAEPLAREALLLAAQSRDDVLGARAWNLLVWILGQDKGQYQRAMDLALAMQVAAERTGNEALRADALHNLGSLLSTQGRYPEALAHNERALPLFEKALGPEHPSVGLTVHTLGWVLHALGRYEEARARYEEALALLEKVLGPEHPQLSYSLNGMGLVLDSLGRYEESRAWHERALALREVSLGPEHPLVSESLSNLGIALWRLGQLEPARARLEHALALDEKRLGPEDPRLAESHESLAIVLASLGEYAQARARFERALACSEKLHGPEHPQVSHALGNLARLNQLTGRYEQARTQLERAHAQLQKPLGAEHPNVASLLQSLGWVRLQEGRAVEAIALLERARALLEKALGPEHVSVLGAQVALGRARVRAGQLRLAERHLRDVPASGQKALGLQGEELAAALLGLGELALARSAPAEALAPLEQALLLARNNELAEVRLALAQALWATRQDSRRAVALATQARDFYQRVGHAPGLAQASRWLAAHAPRASAMP